MNRDGPAWMPGNRTSRLADSIGLRKRRNEMCVSPIGSEHPEGAIRVYSETDGIVAVCLSGDFDLTNASVAREHIDSALESGNHLIVDLTEATFIDSSVINVLFGAAKAVAGRNQTVVLQVATALVVERALELVAIESVLPCARDRTEAVQIVQQTAASA
jgi:anti-anti-sigma factor